MKTKTTLLILTLLLSGCSTVFRWGDTLQDIKDKKSSEGTHDVNMDHPPSSIKQVPTEPLASKSKL